MIMSTGTIAAWHLETGTNPIGMGWYSYHKITGANGHKIIFIMAYLVFKDYILLAGENTSFFHQWHALTKCRQRGQILDDLKAVILWAISKGSDICVAMDANKALDTKKQHFQWNVAW
jgi:hypothetical protein